MSWPPAPYYDCAMITDLASFFFSQARVAEEEAGRMYDAVIGIVTDIKDEAKLCRVKVKIPTMPEGNDNTWWCNWVSVGGGKDRGWFSVPEVDDEVLLMFEHGDIGRPLIIGALWNGKDKPPDSNGDGSNKKRMFKSKSGSTVTLDDDKGTIEIKDGGGKGIVTIAKDNKINIEAKTGDVTFFGKDEVNLLAAEITIKATGECKFAAGSGGLKASGATAKVNAGAVKIMGSTVDFNPGGVAQADAASGTVSDVPDPVKG